MTHEMSVVCTQVELLFKRHRARNFHATLHLHRGAPTSVWEPATYQATRAMYYEECHETEAKVSVINNRT